MDGIKVNSRTGKITIRKGLKKGLYKVKVKAHSRDAAASQALIWAAVSDR